MLAEAGATPFIGAVLTAVRGGTDALLPFLTSRPDPVFTSAWRLLAGWLGEVVPEVPEERRVEAADLVVRLLVSHMLLPSFPTADVPGTVSRAACAVLGVARDP
ncbi:hypothetical protein IQ279_21175 [Streptomyces verrucosisporus]|uniref:hypothetical protein n=1 Tax=Streptomyces verrucosisporus TaxID=1695161 RepID=UPI0019D30778|nr:hypothetical protein [Streptomyces verrucosisporus]MBN3932104.1 hypothetical protein [Streptomyces verrucosisporus]